MDRDLDVEISLHDATVSDAYAFSQIEERRRHPRDDHLTRMATLPVRGQLYTDEQILFGMVGFLLAGHESTTV